MPKSLPLFIQGEFVPSRSTQTAPVTDPSTQEELARVPFATREEMEKAVQSAAQAFEIWKETPPSERARLMMAYQALLKSHQDELAECLARENGKVLADAKG